jgi:choline dehydrogenase
VIDASVMPEVPRANTHLTTVMIAEHMAARFRA